MQAHDLPLFSQMLMDFNMLTVIQLSSFKCSVVMLEKHWQLLDKAEK